MKKLIVLTPRQALMFAHSASLLLLRRNFTTRATNFTHEPKTYKQASFVSLMYGGFLYCECDALDSRAKVAVEVLQYGEGADGSGFGAEYARA